MISATNRSKQEGLALILSLLLLFVLITLAVAGFNNTLLQERSAGNARLQAAAFNAASAGAVNSINFFQSNRDREDIGITDKFCGVAAHTGWYDEDGDAIPSGWVVVDAVGGAILKQRMYCLADIYPCNEDIEVDCSNVDRPPRSQLFVASRGEVVVDGKIVATRDIEVRIKKKQAEDPGDGCGALCFPGCEIDAGGTVFPNSNSFQVDGNGGYAVTVGCEGGLTTILDEIRDNRIGNYDGGIGISDAGAPWRSPAETEAFREALETAVMEDTSCDNCYHPDGLTSSGNVEFGTIDNPQITYVSGDADIGGHISGAGILLVTGSLYMNGTPAFQGLIVVLGGTFEVSGGGGGGNPGNQQPESGGSIVLLNAPGNNTFGAVSFNNTGGGNALYRYDCEMLNAARGLLTGSLQSAWNPECNETEDLFLLGAEEMMIASWRENIGWREELFAD